MKGNGWRDEFWTAVLALPFVLCFTPGLQDVAAKGFEILTESVPPWYQGGMGAALGLAFGHDRGAGVVRRIKAKIGSQKGGT